MYTIYDKTTGEIIQTIDAGEKTTIENLKENQDYIPGNYDCRYFKIVSKTPVKLPEYPGNGYVYDYSKDKWVNPVTQNKSLNLKLKKEALKTERDSVSDINTRISYVEAVLDYLLGDTSNLFWKENGKYIELTKEELVNRYKANRANIQNAFEVEKQKLEEL